VTHIQSGNQPALNEQDGDEIKARSVAIS